MASACVIAGSAVARPAMDAPTLTGVSPMHGAVGQKLTIYGHNLGGATVMFGTVQATTVTVDPTGTHVTLTVPPDASAGGTYPIVVTTPGGSVTATGQFSVTVPTGKPKTPARPHIFTFAPLRGKAGTKVTIKGDNLNGAMWVKFSGIKATFTVPSSTKIVALVPKKAHSGQITIRTNTGMATKTVHFIVLGAASV
jgi:hypothetical protein